MNVDTAIKLVDLIVYKPGYELEAEDHRKRFEDSILLTVRYTARESGRPNAEQGYPEVINTYAKFPIPVGDINDDVELYRRIACCLMTIEEHEMREFLRISPTHWAPFHPHQLTGMHAWHNTNTATIPPFMMTDMQFGIG